MTGTIQAGQPRALPSALPEALPPALMQVLFLSLFLFASCTAKTPPRPDHNPVMGAASGPAEFSVVQVGVDRRVELVGIVCRLAGYPEYSVNWPLRYLHEIGKWFSPYSRHPAVRMAQRLLVEEGMGYNAPLSLVIHADPYTLQPLVPLDPLPEKLDTRWTPRTAAAFLQALADFARDTDFSGFFDSHSHLYNEVSERIAGLVEQDRLVSWMEEFFGSPCRAERNILISYLTGFRHYGLSVRLPRGCLALNPVLGVSYWTHAEFRAISPLLSAILIHEFSHGYVNDLVDEAWPELEPLMAALITERRASLSTVYADSLSLAYESVVRACESWFTLETYGEEESELMLALYESEGFDLVRDLIPVIGSYAANRERYPAFRDYLPVIVDYFRKKSGA